MHRRRNRAHAQRRIAVVGGVVRVVRAIDDVVLAHDRQVARAAEFDDGVEPGAVRHIDDGAGIVAGEKRTARVRVVADGDPLAGGALVGAIEQTPCSKPHAESWHRLRPQSSTRSRPRQ